VGLELAWEGGTAALEAFRSYHAEPGDPCRTCALYSICRGGCQIVSRHSGGGAFGPDPECPRVRAHRAAAVCTGA